MLTIPVENAVMLLKLSTHCINQKAVFCITKKIHTSLRHFPLTHTHTHPSSSYYADSWFLTYAKLQHIGVV